MPNDIFGNSVCISADGQYAICGAPFQDTGGADAGAAYVFVRSGTTWTQQQILQASDRMPGDFFGNSVSISADGQYAICGSPNQDTGGSNAGAVYIFIRNGNVWTEQQKIQALVPTTADDFGRSVSISADGQYVICGAPRDDTMGVDAGAAYIFVRNGTIWTQQDKLLGSDIIASNNFGNVVSISADGQYTICGATGYDTPGVNAGVAYIFVRNGTIWAEQQKIQGADTVAGDVCGICAISANGQYAICGAPFQDTGGSSTGAVYIFIRNGNVWTEQQKIQASDKASNDQFGYSVSISADGQYAICGAIGHDVPVIGAGAAYVFKTDNYTPLYTSSIIVDSTTGTTKAMGNTENALIKTGNTSNAGFTVTLPINMVDGRIFVLYMVNADTTGVSFTPAVTGHTNPTSLGANACVRVLYVASTNTWYKV
jgi:hypothetical protein